MQLKGKRLLTFLMCFVMAATFSFGNIGASVVSATSSLTTVTPAVVVTGDGIIGSGAYSAANVGNETSYTIDDLKTLANADTNAAANNQYTYSELNTSDTKSTLVGEGVRLDTLLAKSELTNTDFAAKKIGLAAPDGYTVAFDPAKTTVGETAGAKTSQSMDKVRYYYPNLGSGSESDKAQVPTILAWKKGATASALAEADCPAPIAGQLALNDYNNPLVNKSVNKITAGSDLTEKVLTIGTDTYTRADLLLMERADNSYTYETTGGNKTDYVRGIPMSVLLKDYEDDDEVSFAAADGYDMSAATKTKKQLVDDNFILAYQKGTSASDLTGIYDTAKNDATKYGFLTLYGDNAKPAKLVNQITVKPSGGIDFSTSHYKHITNGGLTGQDGPYDIDAITGATLTIEGPGVKTSVPLSVRDLEGKNAGAARANYTDVRDSSNVERTYEGIDLYYVLHNMSSGTNGIQLTDKAQSVQIKNRNRQTIATFTLAQVEEAHKTGTPILVSYGTSYTDGSNIRPYVFDGGTGQDTTLGNADGCLKLVYNKGSVTGDTNANYTKFSNMAYIYVSEANTPGYKHDVAPYKSAENSQYVLTVTGEEIGREINYKVDDLEKMVQYDQETGKPVEGGMGYRDEYSLSNSTYWYVNEYEGVQLWKLLQKSGLAASKASDDVTKVSFSATDGYTAFDKFSIKQVADPNSFGFYEKNPADPSDGSYEGEPGDLKKTGYPVLVAYGVNKYPYVKKNTMEGYLSGLQNDGGPLRIISGKTEYKHANGSNQAKLLDKVLVGADTYHYSTHKYHSDSTYKGLAEDSSVQVKVLNGSEETSPELKSKAYKVGDIEELIYGGKLTSNQLKDAKIKQFYEVMKGTSPYSDLYEGINLNYFLENEVQLPGYKGTITFSNGTDKVTMNLADVLATNDGSNSTTGITGLSPILAYGKNGAPMVFDKNSTGYQDKITLASGTDYENEITVKNSGGPLSVIFPRSDNADVSGKSVTNVTSITINLAADNYAHTKAPYDTYANNKVTISGAGTKLTAAKDFTVSDLEGKQTIAATGDYSVLGSEGGTVKQQRYRGISLYSLLSSTAVGLKNGADKVKVTCDDGSDYTFTLSEVRKSDYMNSVTNKADLKMLLAYGSADVSNTDKEDGKPLVESKDSTGYDAAYGNSGGPIRLVVGQKDAADVNGPKILKNVKAIEVTAAETTSWNHSSSEIFKQYLTDKINVQVVNDDNEELFNEDYTVGDIESNTSLVEREEATTTAVNTWEGINFWDFVLQETDGINGMDDPISVNVTAKSDGYTKDVLATFGLDALKDGIKDGTEYKSILLAYGMDEYPLASGDKSSPNGEGYDSTVGNNGGPLRLVTHGNQGACVTGVNKIVIKVGADTPVTTGDFVIKADGKSYGYSVNDLKALTPATESYMTKGGSTVSAKGVLLKDLLAAKGITHGDATITINAVDGFEATEKGASYRDIKLSDAIAQKYMVAYEVGGTAIDDAVKGNDAAAHTKVRVYRNYTINPDEWYNELKNVSGATAASPSFEFTVKADDKTIGYTMSDLKAKTPETKSYMTKGTNTSVLAKGVMLYDLLKAANITNPDAKITVNTIDGFENIEKGASYNNITLKQVKDQDYMVAYNADGLEIDDTVKNSTAKTHLRVYRNYTTNPEEWYNELKNTTGTTANDYAFTFKMNDKVYKYTLAELKAMKATSETYQRRGVDKKAKGVLLSDILDTIGAKDNAAINLKAYDGFENTEKGASYNNIPIADVRAQDYLVAYEESGAAIADSPKGDDTVSTAVRVYRQYTDDTASWLNELTCLTGAEITNNYDFDVMPADGTSLPMSGLRSIASDNEGGQWIGTYGGGLVHIKADGTKTVYNKTSTPALATGYVSAVAVDKDGGVWFTQNASYTDPTQNAGVCYLDKTEKITQYTVEKDPGTIPNNYVQAIYIDESDDVWFGSFGGITKFDGETWKTYDKTDGLPAESVNTIVGDGTDGLWIGCYPDTTAGSPDDTFAGGYAHMNSNGDITAYMAGENGETIDNTKLADVWVRGIAVDKEGSAWVVRSGSYSNLENVGGRVDCIDSDNKITHYTGKQLLGDKLIGNTEIRTVMADKDGGLWFGTSGSGLIYCKTPGTVTKVYSSATGAWKNDSTLDNIYCTVAMDGKLFVGSGGGMASIKADTAKTEPALTVKDGNKTAEFTKAQLEAVAKLEGNKKYNYTGYNTMANWKTFDDLEGPTLAAVFEAAGIDISAVSGDTLMSFVASDGYTAKLTKQDVFEDRYCYPNGNIGTEKGAVGGDEAKAGKSKVPAILALNKDGTLILGQKLPNEQTTNDHNKYVAEGGEIIIGGKASKWTAVTEASTASGKAVEAGDVINFKLPATNKDAKVFYTTDGKDPTESSVMYNYQAERNGGGKNPLEIKGDPRQITVKTAVINRGGLASEVTSFTYDIVDRSAMIDELKDYVDKADYRKAGAEAIDAAVAKAKTAVEEADTKTAMEDAIDAAKAKIDKIPTAAEIAAEELAIVKEMAPVELEGYKNIGDYRAEQRLDIVGIIMTAKIDIAAATTADEVNGIVKEAKTKMDEVKTAEQLDIAEAKAELKKTVIKAKAVSASYSSVKVSWNKAPTADGYYVYRATSESGKYKQIEKTVGTKILSFKDKGLTTGKVYYYKVRAYKEVRETIVKGNVSAVDPAKPKLDVPKTVTLAKSGKKAIKVSWTKVSGANGYQVYRALKKSGKYSKIETLASKYLTYKNGDLKRGKTYYYKVRAYRNVSGKKVYGGFSEIKAIKR